MHSECSGIEQLARNGGASAFIGSTWGYADPVEGRTDPLHETPDLIRQTIQMMLEGISEPACLTGSDGTILAANHAWNEVTSGDDYVGLQLGCDFLAFVRRLKRHDRKVADVMLAGFEAVSSGRRKHFQHSYPVPGPDRGQTRTHMVGMVYGGLRFVLIRSLDITEACQLKRQQRALVSRMAHARDYERKYIAHELRHSTEQLLDKLEASLAVLGRCADGNQMEAALADCSRAIDLVQREVRAVSFLCHPPSIADSGLALALEALVGSFCQRLGIESKVDIRGIADGASPETESMLYRIAQEALRNALHFSRRKAVHLRVNVSGGRVRLAIEDIGDWHSYHPKAASADLMALREWVEEMGGRLALIELPHGTRTIASLPLE